MAQLCLWTKIRIKRWHVLCKSAFQCMLAGFLCPNATILLSYISAKIKLSFIWKDDFFFAKIGIFCKSIAGPLHSVVQANTQPFSLGGRIKLIICQIRHELIRLNKHKMKKKTLYGGTYIKIAVKIPSDVTKWRYLCLSQVENHMQATLSM